MDEAFRLMIGTVLLLFFLKNMLKFLVFEVFLEYISSKLFRLTEKCCNNFSIWFIFYVILNFRFLSIQCNINFYYSDFGAEYQFNTEKKLGEGGQGMVSLGQRITDFNLTLNNYHTRS